MFLKRLQKTGLILALGSALIVSPPANSQSAEEGISSQAESMAPVRNPTQLRVDMRKLWSDHVMWTRLFIIATAHNLPNKAVTTQRLLLNQRHIGDAIKRFYGVRAGDQLSRLLTDHILIASDLVHAAKARNTRAVALANRRWVANADMIAAFLNQANPRYWRLQEMRSMLNEHLTLTRNEAIAELQGNYARSVSFYDQAHNQMLRMADELTNGIVRQFARTIEE